MIDTMDGAAGAALVGFMYRALAGHGRAMRPALALAAAAPVFALLFAFGPRGGGFVMVLIFLLGAVLAATPAAAGPRGILVAGLAAGALTVSGPFGAVFTVGALLAQGVARDGAQRRAAIVLSGVLLFVPLVVVLGFSLAAQAQTGSLLNLTGAPAATLSRLAAFAPAWPATGAAFLSIFAFAPSFWLGRERLWRSPGLPVLAGTLGALLTFRSDIDGIVEAALACGPIAGFFACWTPAASRLAAARLPLFLCGCAVACAFSAAAARAAPGPRPLYTLWRIAPQSFDDPPAWGVDHAP